MQLMIMEGERSDFEPQIAQLESTELVINQQVKELKTQMEELVRKNEYLARQLELEENIKQDVTPFCDQDRTIQEHIYHSQVTLIGEI